MITSIEVTGRTEEDAINSALAQLGLTRDDVSVEILERAKSGFLGIGSSPARVRVSYEERDQKVDKLETFLTGLFQRMGVEANIAAEHNAEDNTISVELSGPNVGSLIGRRGETLDAIQHLSNYVMNSGDGDRTRINIDAENYRAKRTDALNHLAKKMAAKVVKYRRNMTLEPMNAYERHVIHTALQDFEGVTTYSTGTDPNRRVVVAYDRPQQAETRSHSRPRRERPAPQVQQPVEPTPVRESTTREWH